MAGGTGEQKSLEQTPTWTVAVVCTVFVIASLLVERLIHRLGQVLRCSIARRCVGAGPVRHVHKLCRLSQPLVPPVAAVF